MAGEAAYRIRIRPRSPWLTPWHASALFGCVCWRYRGLAGEVELLRWLDGFRGGEPPFVLSDAFPDGWLPEPATAEYPPASVKQKKRGPALIREGVFDKWRRGPMMLQPEDPPGEPRSARALHVTVGRKTDTPLEPGGLFELDAAYTAAGAPERFSMFVWGTPEAVKAVHACLEVQSILGFGKRSSAGFGDFSVEGPEPCAVLDPVAGANAFVALSHFVPAAGDPTDGAWGLRVSYPKFHGDLVEHPFKGRLITITPGAVFRSGGAPVKAWYGRVLPIPREGHPAVHYAMCLATPAVAPG